MSPIIPKEWERVPPWGDTYLPAVRAWMRVKEPCGLRAVEGLGPGVPAMVGALRADEREPVGGARPAAPEFRARPHPRNRHSHRRLKADVVDRSEARDQPAGG